MKRLIALCLLGTLASLGAQAEDKSSGCGLGWQVTKKKSLISSWIRATTNAVASNTIGMTLGTSGCEKHDIVKAEKKALHYAEANYDNLQLEMAQGGGEYLEAFASVLGCDASVLDTFSTTMRTGYSGIFESNTRNSAGKMLESVKSRIRATPTLSNACKVST